MDIEKLITACAIAEVDKPTLAATEQFFEVHSVARDSNDMPIIAGVLMNKKDSNANVYFSVVDEEFYFVVYVDLEPEIKMRWTNTEAKYSIYFTAGSDVMPAKTIENLTRLTATTSWNKGDKRNNGTYLFTKVIFEPNPEPGEFQSKFEKLLDYLETDVQGVGELVAKFNGYIQVAAMYHNGNSMLGGASLDALSIKRLSALNLGVDFDIYAEGNLFKEESGDWYE